MHVALFVIGVVLAGVLLWWNFGNDSSPAGEEDSGSRRDGEVPGVYIALSAERRREVYAALRKKGKVPWMERETGYSVVQAGGGLLRESLACLDSYEARSAFDIRGQQPLFTDDYGDQHGKGDDISRALSRHL